MIEGFVEMMVGVLVVARGSPKNCGFLASLVMTRRWKKIRGGCFKWQDFSLRSKEIIVVK